MTGGVTSGQSDKSGALLLAAVSSFTTVSVCPAAAASRLSPGENILTHEKIRMKKIRRENIKAHDGADKVCRGELEGG